MTSAEVGGLVRHAEHVMGTVFSFAVRDGDREGIADALNAAVARLHRLDAVFSTYRSDSDVSRLGRGEIALNQCDDEVAEVLARCREVADETDGWFTDHPGGALDPSGWVKGWAVQEASRILREAGSEHHCVIGGGDVQTCGSAGPDRPWRVGVADPRHAGRLTAVIEGCDIAVATSGVAERGAHIVDPHTGRPAAGLLSATLVGDRERVARIDAWATAVFAMGPVLGLEWAENRAGIEALLVRPDGGTSRTSGFLAYARS